MSRCLEVPSVPMAGPSQAVHPDAGTGEILDTSDRLVITASKPPPEYTSAGHKISRSSREQDGGKLASTEDSEARPPPDHSRGAGSRDGLAACPRASMQKYGGQEAMHGNIDKTRTDIEHGSKECGITVTAQAGIHRRSTRKDRASFVHKRDERPLDGPRGRERAASFVRTRQASIRAYRWGPRRSQAQVGAILESDSSLSKWANHANCGSLSNYDGLRRDPAPTKHAPVTAPDDWTSATDCLLGKPSLEKADNDKKRQTAATRIQAQARRRAAFRSLARMETLRQHQSRITSRRETNAKTPQGFRTTPGHVPSLPIAATTAAPTGAAKRVAQEPLAILRQLRDQPEAKSKARVDEFRLRLTVCSAIEAHVRKTGALRRKAHPLPTLPPCCPTPSTTMTAAPLSRNFMITLPKTCVASPRHVGKSPAEPLVTSKSKRRPWTAGPVRLQEHRPFAFFAAESSALRSQR